jgi:hypothetical protein
LEDCVAWARKLWQKYFHNDIAQLLHNFPPGAVNIPTLVAVSLAVVIIIEFLFGSKL